MRTASFDFTPYRRSTVGFDRLFDILEGATRNDAGEGYPPYNVERRDEDSYRITIAVAGFRADEIDMVAQQNSLVVTGRKGEEQDNGTYLHRGIATRGFERRFQLADFVQVRGADLRDGLLTIDLTREVPEAMKPRKIVIGEAGPQRIATEGEDKQAA